MSTTEQRNDPAAAPGEASREVVVTNRLGIHARPAALLVKTASGYRADIKIEKDGLSVSAKSIMGVLTIEGYCGARLRITARGADAAPAVQAVSDLFEQKFYED